MIAGTNFTQLLAYNGLSAQRWSDRSNITGTSQTNIGSAFNGTGVTYNIRWFISNNNGATWADITSRANGNTIGDRSVGPPDGGTYNDEYPLNCRHRNDTLLIRNFANRIGNQVGDSCYDSTYRVTVETTVSGRLDSVVTIVFSFNQPIKRIITRRVNNPGTRDPWVVYCCRLNTIAENVNCVGIDTRGNPDGGAGIWYIGSTPGEVIRPARGDFDDLIGLRQVTASLNFTFTRMFTMHIGGAFSIEPTIVYRGFMYRFTG